LKFNQVPIGYYDSLANQRATAELIAKELQVKSFEDWYSVSYLDIRKAGGAGLLKKYGNSQAKMLQAVYPEYNWYFPFFAKTPRNYFSNKGNQANFMEDIKQSLRQMGLSPNALTSDFIGRHGGYSLLSRYKSINKLIAAFFPNTTQAPGRAHQKSQLLLLGVIRTILGKNVQTQYDYRHPDLRFKKSGSIFQLNYKFTAKDCMELDIFLPALSLGFEYQGEDHYREHYLIGPVNNRLLKDQEKQQACLDHGITLIQVPYYWKKDTKTIREMIKLQRPDLFPE
jgi:hypothetical protein